jgi:MerR family transcriptional regulator, light-induced transcriptional regulator
VTSRGGDQLELQAAADALGVHYQTAYRWVRSGRLPARLVGNKYVVSRADLDALDESRREPAPPAAPSRRRVERQAQRVHEALLDGDEATVRLVARRLVEDGTSVVELIQSVLAPPLRYIGQAWHDGDLPIWVEHRAAAIVERTLGDLVPNPRGRRRGTAMVAAVAGDQHSLPTTMAAVALREANWHVHHLGANMPGDELVRFCAEHDVDIAVLSLTNPDVSTLAEDTADRIRGAGTPTIVGGPGRSLQQLVDDAAAVTPVRRSLT